MFKKASILFISLLILSTSLFSQNIDINLLKDINIHRNKNMDGFYIGMTNSITPVAVGVPLIIAGTGILMRDETTARKGVVIGVSLAITGIITTALKYSVNRDRPYKTYPELDNPITAGSPSFPSGHTSTAFSTATSVSLMYPKWYVIVPAYAWAGTVAYSRMHLGVHYPSDVLGGFIIGVGSAYISYKANKWLQNKHLPIVKWKDSL